MRRTLIPSFVVVLAFVVGIPAASAQHEGHQPQKPAQATQKPAPPGTTDHSEHRKPVPELPSFIPPVSDEDRKAAFPDVEGHAVRDRAVGYYILFDQLEWQVGDDGANGVNLDTRGWAGRDRDRLWFRAEGDSESGSVNEAQAHVLYGRQFARWWDVVAGVRQDFRPGDAQTWAAFGVQGLAPYWFDIETTGYVGASGRTHVRFEVE